MTSPVKGFRKQKDPNKQEVLDENNRLRKALDGLYAGQKFIMQNMMRMTHETSQNSREVNALTNLVATKQVPDGEVIKKDDVAIINFAGTLEDGSKLKEGTGKRTAIRIGSDTFIPGFEAGLEGKLVGETVDLSLTFPEAYGVKELAGKKVNFKVQIVDALRDRTDSSEFDAYVKELDAQEAKKQAEAKANEEAKVQETAPAETQAEAQPQA